MEHKLFSNAIVISSNYVRGEILLLLLVVVFDCISFGYLKKSLIVYHVPPVDIPFVFRLNRAALRARCASWRVHPFVSIVYWYHASQEVVISRLDFTQL